MNPNRKAIDVRTIPSLLSLLATLASPAAAATMAKQNDPASCITRPQLEALMTYALPSVLEGMGNRCSGTLAPNAFLRQSGPALAERYRAESERHWPVARTAMTSLMGQDMAGLGDTTEKAMVTSIVGVAIAETIKPKDCGDVNEAVELLSPLPAENLGRLTAMLMILGSKDSAPGESPFAICPAAKGDR
ncbi:hypothetical protein G432_01140 [Sphingomonas sp. MM-1]|nr:hypothetical protein G432_01140 [Sphingomonas sp. MM-1]